MLFTTDAFKNIVRNILTFARRWRSVMLEMTESDKRQSLISYDRSVGFFAHEVSHTT